MVRNSCTSLYKPGTALSTFPIVSLVLGTWHLPSVSKCSLSSPDSGFTAIKMTEWGPGHGRLVREDSMCGGGESSTKWGQAVAEIYSGVLVLGAGRCGWSGEEGVS